MKEYLTRFERFRLWFWSRLILWNAQCIRDEIIVPPWWIATCERRYDKLISKIPK